MTSSDERDRDLLCAAIEAAILVADQQDNHLIGAMLSEARDTARCVEHDRAYKVS